MSVSDPIADYLTCIRNAVQAKKKRLDIPASNIKRAMTELLKRERFIDDFKVIEDNKQNVLRIQLSWRDADTSAIREIRRISKPGRRIYVNKDKIPRVRGGLGLVVLSTPEGVVSGAEARRRGVGGEVLCTVW